MPNYLLSNNPAVHSVKDLSSKDRIAVPAAGVGFQSRTLQIETARLFGNADYKRFDTITVSLPHPDASAALIGGKSEISAHFSSPPFQYQALEHAGIHKILSSYDVLGGPGTFNLLYTTQSFMMIIPKPIALFSPPWRKRRKSLKQIRPEPPNPIFGWSSLSSRRRLSRK
jgi:NitT/TauT family transport system substrate-binding protein